MQGIHSRFTKSYQLHCLFREKPVKEKHQQGITQKSSVAILVLQPMDYYDVNLIDH